MQAPELENLEAGQWERGSERGIAEFKQKRIVLPGNERGEVGKIGSGTETGLEWKREIACGLAGLGEPIIEGIEQESREIEEVGIGCG